MNRFERILSIILSIAVIAVLILCSAAAIIIFKPNTASIPPEGNPMIRATIIEFAKSNTESITADAQPFHIITEVTNLSDATTFETSFCRGSWDATLCYQLVLFNAAPDLNGYLPHESGWLKTDGDDTFYLEQIHENLYYSFQCWK